ncbi:MAG: gliding motility lipoprotein GldB, partial [Flavobacteriales bacterium]|nr:gliding motility lipoprotein GldB [Flavobacteriales bacterium]
WQIVKAYAENNDVSLARLMATPTEELFNNAKFKPRR